MRSFASTPSHVKTSPRRLSTTSLYPRDDPTPALNLSAPLHPSAIRASRMRQRMSYTLKIAPNRLPINTLAPTSVTVSSAMPHTPMALAM
jgi:hypothetical protein